MSKPQKKRLNELEEKYNIGKESKPCHMLFTHLGYETSEEVQAHPDKPRMTQQEALEDAFKLSEKPGKMEDYEIMHIVGVAVPSSEEAVPVYTAWEMNSNRFKK
jgi:hypothetical protein